MSHSTRYLATEQVSQRFAELAGLRDWSWWWVGSGVTAQLVGYHNDPEIGMDILYIDSTQQAAVTRTEPTGELRVHRAGTLASVLRDVGYTGQR